MATIKKRYKDINDTLRHIRLQVNEGIPYAYNNVPQFKDPTRLFNWLKPRLTYKLDPRGVELLQSLPTLMENNFYGVSGSGDCDCFSIGVLSICCAQNWPGAKIWVKLAGRKRNAPPVHIWTGVTINGIEYPLDMTNRIPHKERYYPYVQKLNFKK